MHGLHALAYYSNPTFAVTPETIEIEVREILRESRVRNRQDGLTGALFFDHRYFLQVLEGDRTALSATLGRVWRNPLHENLVIIGMEPISERAFGEWSLGYLNPDATSASIVNEFAGGGPFEPSRLSTVSTVQMITKLVENAKLAA